VINFFSQILLIAMSDDEYIFDDSDSGNVSPEPDDDDDDYIGVDDVGLGEEPGSSRSDPRAEDDFLFEVLSTEKIVEHMVDCIKEVNNVIQIPTTTVRILLNHFKWDKEKLMERYYSEDQEAMFAEAKVVPPHRKITFHPPTGARSAKTATFECEICFLTLPKANMTGLECGHFYCKQCWTEYLSTKIMDEGASQSIECPGSSCDILVDDQTVMNLVKDSRIKLKYQQLITNSFVQASTYLPT